MYVIYTAYTAYTAEAVCTNYLTFSQAIYARIYLFNYLAI